MSYGYMHMHVFAFFNRLLLEQIVVLVLQSAPYKLYRAVGEQSVVLVLQSAPYKLYRAVGGEVAQPASFSAQLGSGPLAQARVRSA